MAINRKDRLLDAGIVAKVIQELFPGVSPKKDQILVKCLWHDDKTPSLSINVVTGQCNCFACRESGSIFDLWMKAKNCDFKTALNDLEKLAGIAPEPTRQAPQVVATYYYHTEAGEVAYYKKRFVPGFQGRSKSFAFYHTEKGNEVKGRGCDAVLYNQHLIVGVESNETCFVVEGEAKADLLTEWGFVATTLDSGGQSGKGSAWKKPFEKFFAGHDVVVLPDNDDTGRTYADTIAHNLVSVASSVKILNLPGLPQKGDILDWAAAELEDADLANTAENRATLKEKFLSMLPYAETFTAAESKTTAKKKKGQNGQTDNNQEENDQDDPSSHKNNGESAVNTLLSLVANDKLFVNEDDDSTHIKRYKKLHALDSRNVKLVAAIPAQILTY